MFSQILTYIGIGLFVLFFFGFCIFIHELGHFLVAKWRGMHIIAFSIGFKKVWGYKYKGVEYRIGCLPFGGYVDLPQIDATGIPKDENGNELPKAKPIDRILTAFSGPFFNLLFGFALGCVVWYYGIPQKTQELHEFEVATVEQASPEYKAGLRPGDVITSINGRKLYCTWHGVIQKIVLSVGKIKLGVRRDGKAETISYVPKPNPDNPYGEKDLVFPFFSVKIPVVLYPFPDSPAEKAGIRNGDVVVTVNGKPIANNIEFVTMVKRSAIENIKMQVKRNGKIVDINNLKNTQKLDEEKKYMIGVINKPLVLITIGKIPADSSAAKAGFRTGDQVVKVNGKPVENAYEFEKALTFKDKEKEKKLNLEVVRDGKTAKIGNIISVPKKYSGNSYKVPVDYDFEILIQDVVSGSAAQAAGMKAGDVIIKIDNKPIYSITEFSEQIQRGNGSAISYTVRRGDKTEDISVNPKLCNMYGIGVQLAFINHPNPWQQFTNIMSMSYKTLRGIFYGLANKAGISDTKSSLRPSHVSGPIGIVRVISHALYYGSLQQALYIIVVITFSLAVINLLPIPVLDGGHIMLALIEMIFRRPLPAAIIQPVTAVFVVLLISFMLYVSFYDSKRVYNDIVPKKEGTVIYLKQPS